jgi:hypothetical protein
MKKLIYFTLGNDSRYLRLAKLCIDSIYANDYDGDILIITNLKDQVVNSIKFLTPVYFLNVDESNLINSSANKIRIYEWHRAKQYSKIVYCDIDMICVGSMDVVFEAIEPNKICFSTDQHEMFHVVHAGYGLLTDSETIEMKTNKRIGVNAGLIGFNSDMLPHFKLIYKYYSDNIDKMGHCLEQPAINIYCYRNNLLSRSLTKVVCQRGYYDLPCTIDINNYSLIHFQGGKYNFSHKYHKIQEFKEFYKIN